MVFVTPTVGDERRSESPNWDTLGVISRCHQLPSTHGTPADVKLRKWFLTRSERKQAPSV